MYAVVAHLVHTNNLLFSLFAFTIILKLILINHTLVTYVNLGIKFYHVPNFKLTIVCWY